MRESAKEMHYYIKVSLKKAFGLLLNLLSVNRLKTEAPKSLTI